MVFQNQANNPILGDINEDTDVFLRDRETGLTELISVNNFGTGPGNDGSFSPSVSANGRFVVFRSRASDLTIGGNDGAGLQIFLRDRATSTTRLISLNSANTAPSQGNDNIFPSDISADGRFVVFQGDAIDLDPFDTGAFTDVFLRDMVNETTVVLSRNNSNTTTGAGSSFGARISDDGGIIAFTSVAPDLVAGDTNEVGDVFTTSPFPTTGPIVSATLPASRSVQVGTQATAFASIINTGAETAVNCSIRPLVAIPADFVYQRVDTAGQTIGEINQAADIAAAGAQSFVVDFIPTAAFASTNVELTYDCANSENALSIIGLNSLQLSADTDPVADIIGLTTVVDLETTIGSTALFAVGSANIGITANLTVSVDDNGSNLPLTLNICQTDTTGACASEIAPDINLSFDSFSTASFAVFVEATDEIANDPANHRIFIRFTDDGGVIRGATSSAVRTQ